MLEAGEVEAAIRARPGQWALGAPGTGLVSLGQTLVAATGDGRLHFLQADSHHPVALDVHDGAVLAIAADTLRQRIVTGGDDGRVGSTTREGSRELFSRPGQWIDAVAVSSKGVVAAGIGRSVWLWKGDEPATVALSSTVAGLAFDGKGKTLAAAHYGGVSLIEVAGAKARRPRLLAWKGSHIGVTFSPNGRFAVSVMGENALHGWRLSDGADMAMSGYPAKPRSLSWSSDGEILASSGAGSAILWSFSGRNGPMGTAAITLGGRGVQVTALVWHPGSPFLAIGYRDGLVQLCRQDGAELALRAADGDSIAHMCFSASGNHLGVLTQSGLLTRVELAV